MKAILLLWCCFLGSCMNVQALDDWGRNGHRATGQIAEAHLSAKARKAIDKLLNGESLAMVSTYADEIRSDTTYRKYGPWHYVNYPFDSTYEAHPKSEKGDIIVAINTCISVLKDNESTQRDKVFHLKMLVHFIGDLHQPLHIGMAEDRGGNDFQVQWFDEGTNLHVVWDTKMIDSYNMSYSELADNRARLTEEQLEFIQSGTVLDWMQESRELCKNLYTTAKVGDALGYRYMYAYMDILRTQLQKGGIRLAAVLNDIFG
ncbi:MAG: S1/P1 nuclease [Bacteroidota bacterium]